MWCMNFIVVPLFLVLELKNGECLCAPKAILLSLFRITLTDRFWLDFVKLKKVISGSICRISSNSAEKNTRYSQLGLEFVILALFFCQ